ncbi:MAG: ornithine carbamoyltransferase [Candidatus Micrarchaeota archaeon]|nr:ornithine carbamoyltransferase [Candidatus Micrarchaeota archaeon]MDE1824564.1 ornithine carbamoyltransferase [Candidatus Micrarchaeota archaeon]MDE1849639.1 ornithine carbamoyltransferase [Candidatus Micrarchaeota archaeon]
MNFLCVDDFGRKGIESIFSIADDLKADGGFRFRRRKTLALLFEKASTRTRVSFEAAMAQLGGYSIYIDSRSSQMSRGETVADTAKVLSSYVDFIAARMYRHSMLVELSRFSSVPVINALTDLEHPCQALSDLYTIREAKKRIKGLRIAIMGDIAANTANSLMVGAAMLGAKVSLVGPDSCAPNDEYVRKARKYSKVEVGSDIKKGLRNADIVSTDTFVSMGQEDDAERRREMFMPYQLNDQALSYARRNASVMHCLPAHRGEEITASVIDGRRSIVWRQAKNKLLVEKAIILYLSKGDSKR